VGAVTIRPVAPVRIAGHAISEKSLEPLLSGQLARHQGIAQTACPLRPRLQSDPAGREFDSDAAYVRRWVPELAPLPTSLVHRPWSTAPGEFKSAGVDLGKTYPVPIIDHSKGRERALNRYANIRVSGAHPASL